MALPGHTIGAYQSDGAFVMRDWAEGNSDTRSCATSARMFKAAAGRSIPPTKRICRALADRLISRQVAAQAYAVGDRSLRRQGEGSKFDMEVFRNNAKLPGPRSMGIGVAIRRLPTV